MKISSALEFNPFLLRPLVKEKMSFSQLALECGVTKQAVANWFSLGKVTAKNALKIKEVLSLSEDEFKEIFV